MRHTNFGNLSDRFERQAKRARNMVFLAGAAYFAIVATVLGFIGWVVVKLMQHFAII